MTTRKPAPNGVRKDNEVPTGLGIASRKHCFQQVLGMLVSIFDSILHNLCQIGVIR